MFKNKITNATIQKKANDIMIKFPTIKKPNIVCSSYLCRKFLLRQTNTLPSILCFEKINHLVVFFLFAIASQFYRNNHRNKYRFTHAVNTLLLVMWTLIKFRKQSQQLWQTIISYPMLKSLAIFSTPYLKFYLIKIICFSYCFLMSYAYRILLLSWTAIRFSRQTFAW